VGANSRGPHRGSAVLKKNAGIVICQTCPATLLWLLLSLENPHYKWVGYVRQIRNTVANEFYLKRPSVSICLTHCFIHQIMV